MLLSRDDARSQQLFGTLELCLRDLQPGSRDVQVRLGLVERVLDISRIDLREERAGLYLVADVDVQPKDLPGCLGLDLHLADGLHVTRGLCDDHQISAHDSRRLKRWRLVHVTTSTSHEGVSQEGRTQQSHPHHMCAPMCSVGKSLAITPSCR